MSKYISHQQLTETLGLTECKDGWWLYDKTRGMNLSLRAKSPTDAFVNALSYYQKRLAEVEKNFTGLSEKVNAFVEQFVDEEES
jgi:hypothetical protein